MLKILLKLTVTFTFKVVVVDYYVRIYKVQCSDAIFTYKPVLVLYYHMILLSPYFSICLSFQFPLKDLPI